MPFDWSSLSKTIGEAGDVTLKGIGLSQQAEQAKADIEQRKAELAEQSRQFNEKKTQAEQAIFIQSELPQFQDTLKQYGNAMTSGNTKLAQTIKEKNVDFFNSVQDKAKGYGMTLPPIDFDILDSAGKEAGDLISKSTNFYTRYNSLNEQQRKEGEVAALLVAGPENRLQALESIANVKKGAQANADVSRGTGGAVTSTGGAAALSQLGAETLSGTANEGNLVVGAKPVAGTTAKDVGEAIIKQLDTFKSSPDNKPLIEQATAIANAATNLDIAITQDNPAALGSAFTQVSKAAGETRITDEDIKRISPNPAFTASISRAYKRYIENGILPQDAKTLKAMILAQEVANGKAFLKGIDKASNRADYLVGTDKNQLADALMKDNNINTTRIRFLDAPDKTIVDRFNKTQDIDEKKELQKILKQRQALK